MKKYTIKKNHILFHPLFDKLNEGSILVQNQSKSEYLVIKEAGYWILKALYDQKKASPIELEKRLKEKKEIKISLQKIEAFLKNIQQYGIVVPLK